MVRDPSFFVSPARIKKEDCPRRYGVTEDYTSKISLPTYDLHGLPIQGREIYKTQLSFGWGNYTAAHSHVDPGGRVNKTHKSTCDDAPITEHTSVDGDLCKRCEEYAKMRGPIIASRGLDLSIRGFGCAHARQCHSQLNVTGNFSTTIRLTVLYRVCISTCQVVSACGHHPFCRCLCRSFIRCTRGALR